MFIFEDVPWLRPFLSWSFAASVVWLVVAMPSFLLAGIFHSIAAKLWAARETWAERVKSKRLDQRRTIAELTLDVMRSAKLHTIDVTAYNAWRRPIDSAVNDLRALTEINRGFDQQLRESVSRIVAAVDDLTQLDSAVTAGQGAGTKAHVVAEESKFKLARINVWMLTPLLIFVLLANSVLSSLVFEEILPAVQTPLGPNVPLSWIVAILVALTEVATGLGHGITSHRDEGDYRKLSLLQVALALIGFAVIFGETFFYSMFATADGTRQSIQLLGVALPLGTGFTVIGFVLGAMLFFLTSMLYSNVAKVSRYGGTAKMLKRFKALEKTGKSWQRFLEDMREAETETRNGIEQLKPQVEAVVGRAQGATKLLGDRFRGELSTPPDWVKASMRPLTEDEARSLFAETHLYMLIVCVCLAVTFALGVHALTLGLSTLPTWVSMCAAAGLALAPLVVGQVWGQVEREHRARDQEGSRDRHNLLVWGAPIAVTTIAWLYFIFRTFHEPVVYWPLAFATVPALALLFCHKRNAMLPGFLRPILTRWAHTADAVWHEVTMLIAGTAALIFEVTATLFAFIGKPVGWLLSVRRKAQSEAAA